MNVVCWRADPNGRSCGAGKYIIYTVTTFKYTDFKILRTSILDYLREGFPWPARPFKHTESNSFKHTVTTFKYTNWYLILPPVPHGLARPPHI
jgi:hypothetical protein